MNVVLLGDDATVRGLARAAEAAGQGVRTLAEPADLAADPPADVLVVGRTADPAPVRDLLRAQAVARRPLWLALQAAWGAPLVYELSLIRDDQGTPLRPLFPARLHPLTRRLRDLLTGDRLGPLVQAEFVRRLPVRSAASDAKLLASDDVDQAALADVDLLRWLVGEFEQLTALRTGVSPAGALSTSLALGRQRQTLATWTCQGTRETPGWTLTVTLSGGTVTLSGGETWDAITWEESGTLPETVTIDAGRALWVAQTSTAEADDPLPDWHDAVRLWDILEIARQSLERRRTLDLHFEVPSERSQFKSQMTALGCGVLLWSLFGSFVLLALGATAKSAGLPDILWILARAVVFAPLAVFLALQLLVLLAKPPTSRE